MDMEQLQADARALQEATDEVARLVAEIPPDLLARIRDAHSRAMCNAHDEGLACCLD